MAAAAREAGVAWDRLEGRVLMSSAPAAAGPVARVASAVVLAAATPAIPAVTSLTLINADTDQPMVGLTTLTNGATLDLSKLPTKRMNVRANVNSTALSVRFAYDSNANYRVESGAPFSLAGDSGGNYAPWTPTVGSHTIKVTPYSKTGATGTAGAVFTITFKVVAGTTTVPPVVPPTVPPPPVVVKPVADLINAATDQKIATLTDGYVIDLSKIGTRLNIQGTPVGTAGSLDFRIDGVSIKTESFAPYTIGGDAIVNGKTDYLDWTPPVGQHTFQVVQWSKAAATGTVQGTTTLALTVLPAIVAPPPVPPVPPTVPTVPGLSGLTLVNANTDLAVGPLAASGTTIDLTNGQAAFTIRADPATGTSAGPAVGSVVFAVDGVAATDDAAPFTLGGEDGVDLLPWAATVGTHVIQVTPYALAGGLGDAGAAVTATVTVTNTVPPPPPPVPVPGPTAYLMNAATEAKIATLTDGYVIDLGSVGTRLNIRALPVGTAGSIVFKIDGAVVKTETTAPYAIGGDNGPSDYLDWTPPVGQHVLQVVQYSAAGGAGTVQGTTTLALTVLAAPLPPANAVSVAAVDPTAKETGQDAGAFLVSRTGPTTAPLVVALAVGGSAAEGLDYAALPRTVTIPVGAATVTFPVVAFDDVTQEADETATVTLVTGAGYSIAPALPSAIVTIGDDDAPAAQMPFTGRPVAVPAAVVQAEDFDTGGDFVAYHVPLGIATTNPYRPGVIPPIAATADGDGGYQLDQAPIDSYYEYAADVAAPGLYDLTIRYAAGTDGGTVHVQLDDVDVTGPITLAPTGGWDAYQVVTVSNVPLGIGRHNLTLGFDSAPVQGGAVASVDWFAFAPAAAVAGPASVAGGSAAPAPVLSAAPVGTTGLALSWAAPAGGDLSDVVRYRVTYTGDAYPYAPAGQRQTLDVPGTASSVVLSGLVPFTLYTVDVTAIDAAGDARPAARATPMTAPLATQRRYLYSLDAPRNKIGFTNNPRQIQVFDVSAGHQWVRNIPLPAGVFNIRGLAASVATGRLF
ncbi:MAG: polymorphic rane protein, partial [Phycisphaerales bacterium]|nr:polymorphic rane protein [Phycisphaerales bacterium]